MQGGLARTRPSPALSCCQRARQGDEAVQLRKQQRADVQLRLEAAGSNEAHDLRRRNELGAYAGLGLERSADGTRLDKERMESLRGLESLPFKPGKDKRIAVKVIDVRGNEVMVTRNLNESGNLSLED